MVTTEDEIQGVYDARHRPSLLVGAATELLSGPSSSLTVQMNCQLGFVRKHFILPPSCMCLSSCCLRIRGSCQTCDKLAGVTLLAFTYLDRFLLALDKVVGTCKTTVESDCGDGGSCTALAATLATSNASASYNALNTSYCIAASCALCWIKYSACTRVICPL